MTPTAIDPATDVAAYTQELARCAKAAARVVGAMPTAQKNAFLCRAAELVREQVKSIQEQNELDLKTGAEKGLSAAMLDRLRLTDARLEGVATMLEEVAALPDPVGEITGMRSRPSGIQVGHMRVPLGVIAIVYESRPNVTADAAALCLKSGNAVILRGGSEAIHSNRALVEILHLAAQGTGVPSDAIAFVNTTDREAVRTLLTLDDCIDVVVPRGGKPLIKLVVETATVPVLKHYDGNCHVYVHRDANLEMALSICINAKTQRPGVCNAAETFLIDRDIADILLPRLGRALLDAGVEIRGDDETQQWIAEAKPATEDDWYEEYLDLIVAIRVVDGFDEAADHIAKYGSTHTETIVTENYTMAQRFLREVDSSSVMVNASTRFSDGGEYGLGAEIGISTNKMHARGPVGLEGLTTQKFIVFGRGEIRT